ncbi:MAG: acyl-CoA dehydrogenase family protein [bacterium]|nr:acyl-CoA dehydrogenase family protein [bacterium]
MQFTPEQEEFRTVVRDFALQRIAPHAETWDREHTFPTDVVLEMGDLGLFGLAFPERWGGAGAGLTTVCLVIEEIGRVDQSLGVTLEVGTLGAEPINRHGTEAQKERWLPDLVAGRALSGFGLTEPGGGSDAFATETRAALRDGAGGEEWVLNGTKAFITNSGTPITSLVTVTARTGPEEISNIIVPSGTPGFGVEPPYRKLGWHASDTHGLTFDDCAVPADCLLGERGQGVQQFLRTLDAGRIAFAALAVGLIAGCLDECLSYASERNAFGKPIGAHQAIAFKCADMAVALETSRLATYEAARLYDEGRPYRRAAAIAKLAASEAAVTAAREATQVFGGYGFMDESPVSRFYRDAKILEIGEGTSEIQRLVISREHGLPV